MVLIADFGSYEKRSESPWFLYFSLWIFTMISEIQASEITKSN
jgi:hypothetical protein